MRFIYFLAWTSFRVFFRLYFRWRVYQAGRVPGIGPVIIASNHASFLDPPLVGTSLPREVSYLARESLFRYPGIGWLLRHVHAVPVDRDGGGAAGLKAILDRLLEGGAITLFPEGTRTPDGRLQAARSGIGLAVIKSGAPVVPLRIFGSFEAFGRHVPFPRPARIVLKYGEPLEFADFHAEARTCTKARLKEIYVEVTRQIMQAIDRLEPHDDLTRFP